MTVKVHIARTFNGVITTEGWYINPVLGPSESFHQPSTILVFLDQAGLQQGNMHFLHLFLFFLVVLTPHQNEAKPTCNQECEEKIMAECVNELFDQGITPGKTDDTMKRFNRKFVKCCTDKVQHLGSTKLVDSTKDYIVT